MAVQINGDGLITVDGTSTTQGRVRLAEDTDNGTNYVELTAPALLAANRTITFPDATTTVVGTDATQTLTNKTLTSPTISGTPVVSGSLLNLATVQNSTSGTNIDFGGIPSWVKRITVIFNAVSFTATDHLLVQLGTSGGIDATGYSSVSSTGTGFDTSTAGYIVRCNSAAFTLNGLMTIINITGNTWVSSHSVMRATNDQASVGGGTKDLTGTLTQLRVTRSAAGSFDGGSINILYE